jgi:hypothetical protein
MFAYNGTQQKKKEINKGVIRKNMEWIITKILEGYCYLQGNSNKFCLNWITIVEPPWLHRKCFPKYLSWRYPNQFVYSNPPSEKQNIIKPQ